MWCGMPRLSLMNRRMQKMPQLVTETKWTEVTSHWPAVMVRMMKAPTSIAVPVTLQTQLIQQRFVTVHKDSGHKNISLYSDLIWFDLNNDASSCFFTILSWFNQTFFVCEYSFICTCTCLTHVYFLFHTSHYDCWISHLNLVSWLCFTSHRQLGHFETAAPFTVPCKGREAL